MGNLFVNLPVPSSNAAGAAVDVSAMGATKTIIVGGPFQGTVTIEYSNDDGAAVWAPVPNSSFVNQPGRVTIDLAVKWMRAVMDAYKGGSANADVGAPAALASFAAISVAPVDISAMSSFKTVVSPAANLVEISEDGTSWSQAFSFQNGGGQSAVVVGRLARCLTGMVWMGASPTGDGGSDVEFPQPFVSPPEVRTIFVRATGDDTTGDGKTIPTAYRTVQRATLDVPLHIQGGAYYVIDATDLIEGGAEVLPPNYALPAWKSSTVLAGEDFDRANYRGAVTLQAEPRDVPALGTDAVIELGDLESTDVGGPIVASSGATPILITTTVPHKLVQSPTAFGIFGVFAGVVQVVEISGNSQPEANGIFFALVTKPTVDESTTFELYDFDLNPVAGSGAGAGGTVSILFVKDQHSGQTQIKLSTPRASWLPNDSLKGKMVAGVPGVGDSAFIYANTDDTLFLASNGEPGFFGGTVHIVEPSCVLQCADSEVFSDDGFVGGFNVVGVDSICLSGIEVKAAPDGSGLLHSGGVCLLLDCSLELPKFALQGRAIGMRSRLVGPSYNRVCIEHDRCLVENVSGVIQDYWDAFHGTVIIQDEEPLPSGPIDWILGVKVISQADPVFAIENDGSIRWWCGSIEGGAGDAIAIRAQGDNQLYNVGGSGWAGTALVVDTGAQVELDVFSFVKTDEMLVGQLAARTFDDFRTNPPLQQQFDVTYDPTAGAPTQATGTASRVFQP